MSSLVIWYLAVQSRDVRSRFSVGPDRLGLLVTATAVDRTQLAILTHNYQILNTTFYIGLQASYTLKAGSWQI